MDELYGLYPIMDSLCVDCIHLMSRSIGAVSEELCPEAFTEFDFTDDGKCIPLAHNICLLAMMELNHAVYSCNKFKAKPMSDLT